MAKKKRIQSLNQLRNLKNFVSMCKPDKVSDAIVESLAKEGKRIIEKAYEERDWTNRTYNLYNSYVAGVFVKGKLVRTEYLYDNQEQSPKEGSRYYKKNRWYDIPYGKIDIENGRKEAENFLKSYGARHRSGIRLVVAAAMYYSGILEGKGYHVLSNIYTELENVSKDGFFVPDAKVTFTDDVYVGEPSKTKGIVIPSKYLTVRQETNTPSKTFTFPK